MLNSTILTKHPPDPNQNQNQNQNLNPDFYETETLAIPPLDPDLDLTLNLDDSYGFEINLDDMCFGWEPEPEFLINTPLNDSDSDRRFESPISSDNDDVIAKYLCSEYDSNAANSSSVSEHGEHFRCSPVSSSGSGCNVGGSDALNVASPDDGSSGFGNCVVDQKVKIEDGVGLKRKKIEENENGDEKCVGRSQKFEAVSGAAAKVDGGGSGVKSSDEEEKRKVRLIRNRESAQLSRQRKKHYVEELEDKVRMMHSTIADLQGKISYFMAENASLRHQLGSGRAVVPGAPPQSLYPPMVTYPWVPCAPYVVKPPGSHVPLVPIPKLKPQQALSAPRCNNKKVESKRSGSGKSKVKKVASVSFLGLLFFVLLFGGLVPVLDVNFGGFVKDSWVSGSSAVNQRFYDQHKGRVLIVNGHSNNSLKDNNIQFDNSIHCDRNRHGCKENNGHNNNGGSEGLPGGNASEPLFASLYVPRNDKLVKIDGNLIIHSVLASERAMASRETTEVNKSEETGLAIPKDLKGAAVAISEFRSSKGRHPHLYQTTKEQQKEHVKPSAANGKLQQWFQEGLAGPMLSSGMCSEVFQFEVSPTPGAIVPATPQVNVTSKHQQNATRKGKHRRTLHGLPIPIPGSELNITRKRVAPSQKDNLDGNKTASSMVVSVLGDPREASDSDVDGVIRPKSLSKIFVVVLIDSVKYVTYSCMLPRSGPPLVTT